ncbi:MAG: serine/threonine-protein kinase [Polyangiales bacterium]
MSPPIPKPDARARLGAYELVKELKAGGMARLYVGRREGPGGFSRYLALKTVHAHLAHDETFIQMFLDEARLAAQLSHPNIVQVEDLGEVDGVYFMAMELIRGVSLFQILKSAVKSQEPVPPRVTVQIGMEVAAGLHAAHTAIGNDGQPLGVVHRDVSPQNIMVSWSGQVKLLDFGIAKAHGTATSGDTLKGKLKYMPPEQARGRAVDARADQYALGVVLWESVTSRRRFRGGSDFELLEAVRSPGRCSAKEAGAPISDELDAVLNKALEANPDDRFATARDFRIALKATPEAGLSRDELGAYVSERLKDERDDQRQEMPVSSPSISRARAVEPPPLPSSVTGELPASTAEPDKRRKLAVVAACVFALAAVGGAWAVSGGDDADVPLAAIQAPAAAAEPAQPAEPDSPSSPLPTPIEGSAENVPVALALGAETTLLHGEQAYTGEAEVLLVEVLDGSVRLSVDGEEVSLEPQASLPLPQGELVLLWADFTTGAARFDFREPSAPTPMRGMTRGMARMSRGMARGTASAMMTAITMTETAATMTPAMRAAPADDFSAGIFEGRMRALPVQDL